MRIRIASLGTATVLALAALPVSPVLAADNPAAMIDDPACGTALGACFDPDPITILVDDTVTWTNNSANPFGHSATSDAMDWDTGILMTGESGTITFATEGVFGYHCSIHPDMVGTIEVIAAASAGSRPVR